jgi:Trehalase
MNSAMNSAQQILSDNSRFFNGYAYTVPTKGLYPFQWLWDSGFTALGFAKYDEPRAWQELESLVAGQWADGMIPHIVFHQTDPGYFPNVDTWATEGVPRFEPNAPSSSGITQPPVLGFVMRHLLENATDTALAENKIKALFSKVLHFHRFLHTHRDPNQNGLTAIVHPWEAGTDNSPQWDEALARVEVANLPPYTRRDTSHVDSAQRPKQADYDRYLSLLMGYRAVGYNADAVYQTSQFKVANIMFNAILLRSDKDLLMLAKRFGFETAELETWIQTGERGIQYLWNEAAGAFWSHDIVANKAIPVTTSSSFMPLFAGAASPEQAARLVGILEQWAKQVRYLVPSTDPSSQAYEPKRYWRGPVWAIVNWMIAAGLDDYSYGTWATRVREDNKALLQTGFAEYWHPETGEGLGGFHFTWTAAIGLLL